MRNVLWTLSLVMTLCLLGQAAHAVQVIHLKEYLGHTFTDEADQLSARCRVAAGGVAAGHRQHRVLRCPARW